ncbi:MAG: hypothetical protein HY340_01435 [Candidatus Kerfeldbacteria bacterium]|nr:hypothetical protein [Candidatus Kerfeldbacteria bacterium]
MWEHSEQNERERHREQRGERLEETALGLAHELADKENAELGFVLLDEEGRVRPESFAGADGPYQQSEIEQHAATVRERELDWSDFEDQRVRVFHVAEFGVRTEGKSDDQITDELLAAWRRRQYRHDGPLAEIAVTTILNRLLDEEFLVVRASRYDDVVHGADQLIVRKDTGDVVCAFDEVLDEAGGTRRAAKYEKVIKNAKRGGTELTYGLTYAAGKPKLTPIKNIPNFALAIGKGTLRSVLRELGTSETLGPSSLEAAQLLLDALQQQHAALEHETLPEPVRNNLSRFRDALARMKAVLEERVAVGGSPAR